MIFLHRRALCGHPITALTDNWTRSAVSRHYTMQSETTAFIFKLLCFNCNKLCGRPPLYASAPCKSTFWPWKWYPYCPSHVWRGLPRANFSLPRPLCSRLRPDVRNIRAGYDKSRMYLRGATCRLAAKIMAVHKVFPIQDRGVDPGELGVLVPWKYVGGVRVYTDP